LTVPNVITPDGNGKNDFFHVTNLEYYPNSNLVIYNRWGKRVYEDSNYQNNWNGANCSDGVYFYILNINDKSTDGIEKHGSITIIAGNQ
jgi:gliding motility-associated-like protein